MSEYITHTLFALDCRRLVRRFALGGPRVIAAFAEHPEHVILGARTSRGRWGSLPLARAVRDDQGEAARRDLAFLLGWRTHDAADRQFKPIYRTLDTDYLLTPELDGPSEISIAQDVYLLRRFGRHADGGPFPDDLLEPDASGRLDLLSDLLADGAARDLLALGGPLTADDAPAAFRRRETFYVSRERYEAMWRRPPQEVEDRIRAEHLYAPEDPAIVLVEALRNGRAVSEAALPAAVAALDQASHYSRALARFVREMAALERYLAGRLDEAELRQAFQLDVAHTDDRYKAALGDERALDRLREAWHTEGGVP